jgi:hypothetical protein
VTRRAGRRDDAGQIGGVEVLPFAVLICVVGVLLVSNIWAVVDAKLAVDAAAREATRQYVEAEVVRSGDEPGAAAAATEAGLAALAAHGRDRSRGRVWRDELVAPSGQGGYVRCARVTFRASYQVPALTLPWIGGFGRAFAVESHHSEVIDPYRDGVPGVAAAC